MELESYLKLDSEINNSRLNTHPPTQHSSLSPRMNLRSATYHTAREVASGLWDDETGFKDENDVTINTDNDSEPDFDSSDDDDFDPILGGD